MGRKKKKASKPKPLAKPEDLEPGEIVEERELEPGEIVEETDQEYSASDSDNAIPEKLPSAAAIQSQTTSSCPPSTSADIRTEDTIGSKENQVPVAIQPDAAVISENSTDIGSLEQQETEKQTGSNENQAPVAIQPDAAVTSENSTKIGSLEDQPTATIDTSTTADGCAKKKKLTEFTPPSADDVRKQPTDLTQPPIDDGAKANGEVNINFDETITSVIVGNISIDTTKQDLIQVLGIHKTTYLRETVRIRLVNPLRHKFKRYALIKGPKFFMDRLLQCNGWEYKNRKLVVEFETNKSKIPLGSRDARRGEIKQGSLHTSGHNEKGELRPASSASSRQEESVPFINRMEVQSENYNPEVVGRGTNLIQKDKTMAQTLRQRQNEHQLE